MDNDVFLQNGGERDSLTYISRPNHSRCFLICLKAFNQAALCYNLIIIIIIIIDLLKRTIH